MSEVTLVLLRHFPSVWNNPEARRFTGWIDVDLAAGSYERGREVGAALVRAGFGFDICYVSLLKRAKVSLAAVLEGMALGPVFTQADADLNERNYGILQGKTHAEATDKYGARQVQQWRRNFRATPPNGESLKDTCDRVAWYWNSRIGPSLLKNKRVLVVAHGNSLRALLMCLGNMSESEVEKLEIPTGAPLICRLNAKSLALINRHYLEV